MIVFSKRSTIPFLPAILVAAALSCAPPEKSVTVTFTGDIIMHIPVKSCAGRSDILDADTGRSVNNGGFDVIFSPAAKALRGSDIVLGNMEFPVAPPFESRPYVFNCRPEVLGAMKKAGFTTVSLANNHVADQDTAGLLHTLSYLKRYGIDFIGAGASEAEARAGRVYVKNGIRTGFIAYTGVINTAFPEGARVNDFYKKSRVTGDIDAIRKRCDFLVMTAHYGEEYSTAPSVADTALIRTYLERGVDLFIGHHPHLLQRVDRLGLSGGRTAHVFYSLGNFISNQSGEVRTGSGALSTRDSVIVRLTITRAKEGLKRSFRIIPIRTVNEVTGGTATGYRRRIYTAVIPDEMDSLLARSRSADEDARRAAEKNLELLSARIGLIETVMLPGGGYDDVIVERGPRNHRSVFAR